MNHRFQFTPFRFLYTFSEVSVLFFCVGGMLSHPSWVYVICSIFSIIAFQLFIPLSMLDASYADSKYIVKLLSAVPDYRLIEIDLEKLKESLPTVLKDGLEIQPIFARGNRVKGVVDPNFKTKQVFFMNFEGTDFIPCPKAYSDAMGASFVFLDHDPNEERGPFDKFKLFHELAHISEFGVMIRIYPYAKFLISELSIVLMWRLADKNVLNIIVLLLFAIQEILRFVLSRYRRESKADILALQCLSIDEARIVVGRMREVVFKNTLSSVCEFYLEKTGMSFGELIEDFQHEISMKLEIEKHFRLQNARGVLKLMEKMEGKTRQAIGAVSWNEIPGPTNIIFWCFLIYVGYTSKLPHPDWDLLGWSVVAVITYIAVSLELQFKALEGHRKVQSLIAGLHHVVLRNRRSNLRMRSPSKPRKKHKHN